MAPSGKRKRPDRQYSQDDSRPSPHRPDALGMAHNPPRPDFGSAGRGGSGRGRGGTPYQSPRQDRGFRPGNDIHASPTAPASMRSPRPVQARSQAVSNDSATRQALPPQPVVAQREASPPVEEAEPFDFEVFTEEIVTGWDGEGRSTLKEAAVALEDDMTIGIWAQELVYTALRRRLKPADLGAFFKEVNELRGPERNMEDALIDVVALLPPTTFKRLSLAELVSSSGISTDVWRMALETEAVEALGMARERFARKKAAKITNHLYRQSNYNLLREESEGYAKLITEYFNIAQSASAADASPTIALDAFDRVKALVGSFDLDVGRVLDITLDVFANLLVRNFRFFVKFIRASSWWPNLDCPDIVKWQGQGFDSLPSWALPSAVDWGLGDEETQRLSQLRALQQERDTTFWQRARQSGMNAFSEIGARHIANIDDDQVQLLLSSTLEASKDDMDGKGIEKNRIKRLRANEQRQWMRQTKTLPPLGNADAATLLGFKLSFYSSPSRDKDDVMPENLIPLVALLIKIGFISLRDIYPHVYPPDEKMDDCKTKLEKDQEEREASQSGRTINKLALSGALSDDTVPAVSAIRSLRETASSKASSPKPDGTPKHADESQNSLPEPPDQKISLLKSLLAIGAFPEAMFILGRFPWLIELVPELTDYIHRILHKMLSSVYDDVKPLRQRADLAMPALQPGDPAGLPKGVLNLRGTTKKPPKRWLKLDEPESSDGIAYNFYWDDWADNLPVCQSVDDVFTLCETFLNLSGVRIGQDPALLTKLVRIGKQSLGIDKSPENTSRWVEMLKRLLVPALSLTTKNPAIDNEIFELLSLLPTATRYSVYAEWYHGPTARLPDIKRAFERTRKEASDVLKRISKTNVKPMGKALAKAAYGSPGIVLQTAIYQLEAYDNIIEVFVECSRYFTLLGYDVLTWCLLNALGGDSNRDKVQQDGMLTSPWLKALSTFAGAIYKRYGACDPLPVLQYIASELRRNDTTNLELFEQMITAMGGIKSDMIFNDNQVLAMACGETLVAQTLIQMADERHLNQKSAKRLMRGLTESGLSGQILISIAQERQMYAYRAVSKQAPLKVLGSNIDKIHAVYTQYLDFFRTNTNVDQFANAVPDPVVLMQDFGLDVEIAFMIGRSGIARLMHQHDAQEKVEKQERLRSASGNLAQPSNLSRKGTPEPSVLATKDQATGVINSTNAPSEIIKVDELAVEDTDVKMEELAVDQPAKVDEPSGHHPALASLVQRLHAVLGDSAGPALSIPFYATFWSLELRDVSVSNTCYEQEIKRQGALIKEATADRTDPSATGVKQRKAKVDAASEVRSRLQVEMRTELNTYSQTRKELVKQKDHWFSSSIPHKVVNEALLQFCFLPRILLSSLDAQYTFLMIKFLHGSGARSFYTMHLFDKIFDKARFSAILFSATAREAENFGRFINEVLKELSIWHADEAAYQRNAVGLKEPLPGFAKAFDNGVPSEHVSYSAFRQLLHKWHNFINAALHTCLDSGEYMHIRNAILVMRAFHTQFPRVTYIGEKMIARLTKLATEDSRKDLQLSATSLVGNLKPLEKTWVLPLAFYTPHQSEAKAAATNNEGQKASETPQQLNAEAAEFTPSKVAANPTASVEPTNGINEEEDGEIAEEKTQDPSNAPTPMEVDKTPTNQVANGNSAAVSSTETKLANDAKTPNSSAASNSVQVSSGTGRLEPSNAPQRETRSSRNASPARSRPGDHVAINGNDRPSETAKPPREPARPAAVTQTSQRRDDGHASPRRGDRFDGSGHASRPSSRERDGRPSLRASDSSRDLRGSDSTSSPLHHRIDARHNGPLNQSGNRNAPSTPVISDQVNPARLALIERNNDRSASDKRHAQPSRQPSPRRSERGRPENPQNSRYNERPNGTSAGYNSNERSDARSHAPNGPRQDRATYDDTSRRPAGEYTDSGPPRRPESDSQYARSSNQSTSRHQDPSYGRLDRPEAPAGPRGSTAGSAALPTGPSNTRQQIGSSPTIPQQQSSASRNGSYSSASAAPPAPARETTAPAAGVHPSRLALVEPIDTKSPAAPRGPASSYASTPTGPSPGGRVQPPSGPASAGPRNDRRFAALNDTLQGSPAQGASIKGRATRSGSLATPTTPSGPMSNAPPPQSMPPPAYNSRPSEPARGPSTRSNGPPQQVQQTPPRPQYDQRNDYPASRDSGPPTRGGQLSREPSRERMHDDQMRSDHRGPLSNIPRDRPSSGRDEHRDYPVASPRGSYGSRDDAYAKGGPPPSVRNGTGYEGTSQQYPPHGVQNDPYARRPPSNDSRGPTGNFDGPRGDSRAPDPRGGYANTGRPDPRDDRASWGGPKRRDDGGGRDLRKRRGDEMDNDLAKRRRSGMH